MNINTALPHSQSDNLDDPRVTRLTAGHAGRKEGSLLSEDKSPPRLHAISSLHSERGCCFKRVKYLFLEFSISYFQTSADHRELKLRVVKLQLRGNYCIILSLQIGFLTSVRSLSHVQLFSMTWTTVSQASLSITNTRSLLKLTSIDLVMTLNHLILCHPLLVPPSIFPNNRVFSNASASDQVANLSFSFSISPSNEYSGLISFQEGLVGYPCSPRGSEGSSPTPQFKSINSSALSFLYSQNLTSIQNYWKNQSFD